MQSTSGLQLDPGPNLNELNLRTKFEPGPQMESLEAGLWLSTRLQLEPAGELQFESKFNQHNDANIICMPQLTIIIACLLVSWPAPTDWWIISRKVDSRLGIVACNGLPTGMWLMAVLVARIRIAGMGFAVTCIGVLAASGPEGGTRYSSVTTTLCCTLEHLKISSVSADFECLSQV